MKTLIQPDEEIITAHMEWARRLIAQFRFEQDCEDNLGKLVGISELLSRIEEMALDMAGGVSPVFLHAHRECLESIQASTSQLIQTIQSGVDGDELLTRARTLSAFLEDNWQQWHAPVSPDAVEALTRKIFQGAA